MNNYPVCKVLYKDTDLYPPDWLFLKLYCWNIQKSLPRMPAGRSLFPRTIQCVTPQRGAGLPRFGVKGAQSTVDPAAAYRYMHGNSARSVSGLRLL
ncbi:hypothetical protein [Acetobacter sp. LMG 32666]|uniref:hypothetical protein n=1 Tax=Acetobacter sp. LMG 32666 TaxID=2959295 RepID=UPI0030C8D023